MTTNRTKIDRQPPHSLDAEQAVLGSMLTSESAIGQAIEVLQSSRRFYSPGHRKIFDAILDLFEKSQPADIVTVSNHLEKNGMLEDCGGRKYLTELASGVATSANVVYYAENVLEAATLRDMIYSSAEIIDLCYRQEKNADELLDEAEQKIFDISEGRLRTDFANIRELVPHTFLEIEEYKETKGGLLGAPTGFVELDNMTAGLHAGDLIVIAGRPSMGKSALALNIIENYCLETKKAAAFFSLEMSKEQLALRLICGRGKISSHRLRRGMVSGDELHHLAVAAGPFYEVDLFIDDSPSMTVLQMRAKARRLASKNELGLIIIDYLQLMTGSRYAENRVQEISMITRSLKSLARELNVPVIAVSQLSRGVEMRPNKRPQLSDLRESGAIEQDADLVIFVYREDYYLAKELPEDDPKRLQAENKAELIVAKQRNGPTGKINVSFLKEFARFENLAIGYREAPGPPVESGDTPF
ncbi:MAG: replicative DNA helicase [candidate division Zixibacteria bacterium]